MKGIQVKTIFFILAAVSSVWSQSIELANEYFSRGEFDKAQTEYEKLAKKKDAAFVIHENYMNTLLRLKNYQEAEHFLNEQILNRPDYIVYRAELADLYEEMGQKERATAALNEVINAAAKKDIFVYQLQDYLYRKNKISSIIELLEKGRTFSGSPNKFSSLLARAYLYSGNKKAMMEEVLKYGLQHNNNKYVERTIQDNIEEPEEKEMVQRLLYARIQEHPDVTFYNDLLIWFFVQNNEYRRAFMQARALDRRLGLQGERVYELAQLAYNNQEYEEALRMFEYILVNYPQGGLYSYARRFKILTKEQIVKNKFPINRDDILSLIDEYQQLVEEFGDRNNISKYSKRNMALLYAFYLADYDKGVAILRDAIDKEMGPSQFVDQCKLDLGDVYILKNEPWEAALLYMQVDKAEKENDLGELAKLKNAKLFFYSGEFELSKEILDILKKATSREIANDAMELSLIIQDNLGLDTTDSALKAYAAVELLIFQNKHEEAVNALDSLFQLYEHNSIADEVLWLKAKLENKLGQKEAAIQSLEMILANYKYDILADDALFMWAQILEETAEDKSEAMEKYKQLLIEYPGSIFSAEARKKYRALRGDFVF
ncbi:tetratricopeptide repeat protein [Marinilongibacter aquaticus]|uniref:tetratricopeptide repeat protein n=1 Tax=Marinilongibacter aquaticus TaxID=2975157 RepID=UPI0021BDE4E7|nr:tetratricopeptide repeat protein [Marinilongibacter aquaticus]UBM57501.1 tetratricopeptide repeat protein [Marinilongibacter aquaticus]